MGFPAPVYVIDDDPGMLESTRFLLGSLDIQSRIFSDPLAFLQELNDLAPGCVLTDLSMPSMSGIELHGALRDRKVEWPVVLMSGDADPKSGAASLRTGIFDFLEKPFTVERLLEVLEGARQKLNSD
ncbi:MAG TPA: response regulator [Sphingomicrobium sp.]|jgi:two-component system response regulator FixJ|nr:response regulator [Sphingomicrobium sp.]